MEPIELNAEERQCLIELVEAELKALCIKELSMQECVEAELKRTPENRAILEDLVKAYGEPAEKLRHLLGKLNPS